MPDVNVLVYAHRADTDHHLAHAEWLTAIANGSEPFALSELVLQGFMRVVTSWWIFASPSTLDEALASSMDHERQRFRAISGPPLAQPRGANGLTRGNAFNSRLPSRTARPRRFARSARGLS
jgi:predicted nucleic acid-binding protein